MAKIETYTKGITVNRAVPNMVDPNAIRNAGAIAGAVADVAGIAADYAFKHQQANETTLFNEKNIQYQKDAFELGEKLKKDNIDNPFGFSKRADEEFKKTFRTI